MTRPRPPKKTEMIEVRLPDETKRAFMERCQAEGRTASEVVRGFVDDFLAVPQSPPRKARSAMTLLAKPVALATGAALLFAASLVPSALSAAPDLRAAFAGMDRDRDGAVSFAEFSQRADGDILFVAGDGSPPPPGARPFVLPLRATPPESGARPVPPPASLLRDEFNRQDADANGGVDFGEFARFHEAMLRGGFDGADRDRSGGIEPAEYAALRGALPSGHPAPAFAELDRNRDGRIDFAEFSG